MDDKNYKYFYCKDCKLAWKATDFVSTGENTVAICPVCEKQAPECTHSTYNLARTAWSNATGPKTEAGKERVSLNAWKNGLHAKFHIMAPAKPGKFPLCSSCELIDECKESYKYCPKDIETTLLFLQAYQDGKVNDLRELAGWSQAQMMKIMSMMFSDIISRGVHVKTKHIDDAGNVSYTYEKNQLVKELPAFIDVLGFSADQQIMTPKAAEQKEQLQGYVKNTEQDQASEIEYRKKIVDEMKRLREAMESEDERKKIQDRLKEVSGGE